MSYKLSGLTICILLLVPSSYAGMDLKTKKKPVEPSALDKYIQESMSNAAPAPVEASAGSLWTPASRITDLGSDLRATHVTTW